MVSSRDEAKKELVPVCKPEPGSSSPETVVFVEQFVKEVVDFTSQYGSNISISYSAYNIAGNPTKFPDYGDFPQAFFMRTYGRWWDEAPSKSLDYMPQNNDPIVSHDYIDLEYHKEVYPIRVSIYEIYNPGSVVAIWARDETGQWQRLWSGPPQIVPHKPRIFSPSLQQWLDAVLLIGTSELIVPTRPQSLSSLLKELGEIQDNIEDCYNLTPNYLKVNQDLKVLKNTFHKHCVLYKSKCKEKNHKGKLVAKLSRHCQYIPPIEEAFNSLQNFLQEDFPKLIKDINPSSPIALTESESEKNIKNEANKNSGCFAAIPDETVLEIFKKLDLKSLSRCSQVNQRFNNIAHDSLLYSSLNLKPYWNYIDAAVLHGFASKCQYLQRLDLSWCGNYSVITPQDFIKFLQTSGSSSLTHLRLNCCHFVNDAVIEEISRICKNLTELCLRSCRAISNNGFASLGNLEHLQRLELYRTSIETETLCSILRNNSDIRHLNLASMHDGLDMDDIATEVADSCKKLESIDFWKSRTVTVRGIRALAQCTNLKEIDFGWCNVNEPSGDSLRILFNSCRNLEKVYLTAFRGFLSDRDLRPLLLCQNLQQLDILGARLVSPELCIKLLSCLQLRMIDLSFCDGISDAQIFEWRQLYPHIAIKRISQVNR